jgi:hypothetical protein
MHSTTRRRLVALAVLFAGAWCARGQATTVPALRRLVAVGDSQLAGFASGGLQRRSDSGQVHGVAAQLARSAGKRLTLPAIEAPGLPPQLAIVDANGNGHLDAGEVRRPTSGALGERRNPGDVARNLAVPGERLATILEGADERGGGLGLLKRRLLGDGSTSQVARARGLSPTFLLVWIGNDDLQDVAAGISGGLPPVPEFGRLFRGVLDRLADSGAPMAVANLPDPTSTAALRLAAGDVRTCRDRDGSERPVAADALISLYLDPSLLPSPPCSRVITPEQRGQVQATVAAYNAEITSAAADVERARAVGIALVDLSAAYERWSTAGIDATGDGRPDVSMGYLGGFYSLDGVHPTRTGNALIANEFIAAINARFGKSVSPINVARVRARDPLGRRRIARSDPPPIGLIADGAPADAGTLRALAALVTGPVEPSALAVPPSGYRMFGGLETGLSSEIDVTNNCAVVSSPVCTGQRACRMLNATQPTSGVTAPIVGAEAYLRAYHHVNVTAMPSPTEACSPILGFDNVFDLPICSADVCVQTDGQVRYRLRDRINGVDGTTVGMPSVSMPASTWRRVEIRVRVNGGSNDDQCELRVDDAVVAVSNTLDLGTLTPTLVFLSNRQGAYIQPPNPGSWIATYDDIAATQGDWPGPGRVIARQGFPGAPTYQAFTLVGAPSIDQAWSDTPPNATRQATSPASGDPLAQTMLVAPFDVGTNALGPLSDIAACQTWMHARTGAAPDRDYFIRRRLAATDVDTQLTAIDQTERLFSDAILGAFWTSTLATLNGAEVGAVKSGGAGGSQMRVNDVWLACEYRPQPGEGNCDQAPAGTTTTSSSSTTTSTSSSSTSSTTSTSSSSTSTSSTSTSSSSTSTSTSSTTSTSESTTTTSTSSTTTSSSTSTSSSSTSTSTTSTSSSSTTTSTSSTSSTTESTTTTSTSATTTSSSSTSPSIADDRRELEVRIFQDLLQPLGVLRDLPHELLARAGQVAQLVNRRRGNKAAADQSVGEQVCDPRRVIHVALAARDVPDVHGVGEEQLEAPLQHVPDTSIAASFRVGCRRGTRVVEV